MVRSSSSAPAQTPAYQEALAETLLKRRAAVICPAHRDPGGPTRSKALLAAELTSERA